MGGPFGLGLTEGFLEWHRQREGPPATEVWVALTGPVAPLLRLLGALGWGSLSVRSASRFPAQPWGWGSQGEAGPGQPFSASSGRPGSGQPVQRANTPQAEIINLRPPWQPPPPAELTALVLWGTLLSPGPSPGLNELFVGMSG